ncbi:unnamed protein product [Adineta steineri]|uniref:Uncharacterized protein n=1 Tax=Adineta steineri TaxID=433720 RepID=A0A814J931_9BILA|nr:unnamed protein product [Adineta steineri]CAF1076426.1 unnamed protein product [Adineta steineri]
MGSEESWKKFIGDAIADNKIVCRTCRMYNQEVQIVPGDENKKCRCGRLIRCHSLAGSSKPLYTSSNSPETTNSQQEFKHVHSTTVPVTVYGTSKITESIGCKYIRIDHQTRVKPIYDLLVKDCGDTKPAVILSVYGGAKYFTMTEKLEKEIIRGIIDAAAMSNAWILTTGINNGVSKLVGEGISHYRLLKADPNKIVCIGLTKWGTINGRTRFDLKNANKNGYELNLFFRRIYDDGDDTDETIERNHTHCILFDDGKIGDYLNDGQRDALVKEACEDEDHECCGVTIIVEGGKNTIEVLQNDIQKKRPIVFIEDSGRLADVFASLINQTTDAKTDQQFIPSDEVVRKALTDFFPSLDEDDITGITTRIQEILDKKNRHLLNVFRMDRDKSVAETIFKAIFKMKNKQKGDEQNQDPQYAKDEDILLDLASQWNYFDGALPILKKRQHITSNNDAIKEKYMTCYKKLFRESLIKNHPAFVGYFLAAGFDPLKLLRAPRVEHFPAAGFDQLELLRTPHAEHFLAAGFDPLKLIGTQSVEQQRHEELEKLYQDTYDEITTSNRSYIKELFDQSTVTTIRTLDKKLNKFIGSFFEAIYAKGDNECTKRICIDLENHLCSCCSSAIKYCASNNNQVSPQGIKDTQSQDQEKNTEELLEKNKLLRDLFLWSVFMDMPEIAKILLIHQQSRICAALIASAIFKRYSKLSLTVDLKEKFKNQADDFGKYAADFINDCYKYNERSACELLLRQIPLFGNITCMQIAISSENIQLVGTACFDQTLTQVWYNKLSMTNNQTLTRPSQVVSITTFGLLAPWMIPYRENENSMQDISLSTKGINYYTDGKKTEKYWTRFQCFHGSPFIRMCYHFISYIWFLLVFSYMMLYELDSPDTLEIPHWTEIYVIITVSTMFCEEIRKLFHEYNYRMVERWGSTGSTILTVLTNIFYIAPYLLFYLAAYGVVSRALILYRQIPFTGSDIFRSIFYEPYWFIYGDVSDKHLLDEIISNGTQSLVAEATATHVLLAFHMLFINILILNLLIAVFTDTIDKVKENTEFYWRYQRYSFIREYFEQPPCAYPPLIIFSHIILLVRYIYSKSFCTETEVNDHTSESITLLRNFKMIAAADTTNERWDAFENAATHNCARSKIDQQMQGHAQEVDILVIIFAIIHKDLVIHNNKVTESLRWIMNAIARVKMNDRNKEPPLLASISTGNSNVSVSTQTTENID